MKSKGGGKGAMGRAGARGGEDAHRLGLGMAGLVGLGNGAASEVRVHGEELLDRVLDAALVASEDLLDDLQRDHVAAEDAVEVLHLLLLVTERHCVEKSVKRVGAAC